MPWPPWPGIIYGSTTNKRNRNPESFRKFSHRDYQTIVNGIYKVGNFSKYYCHSHWLVFNEQMAAKLRIPNKYTMVDLCVNGSAGFVNSINYYKFSVISGSHS